MMKNVLTTIRLLESKVKLNGLTQLKRAQVNDLSTTEILVKRRVRKKNTKLSNRNRDFLTSSEPIDFLL
ncbi:hypothetical protein BDR07DRAFT_71355 [Suillus spraguei]|nr:hypothetical protein BDR07DRAFT_71355 [Suillus spraguei]